MVYHDTLWYLSISAQDCEAMQGYWHGPLWDYGLSSIKQHLPYLHVKAKDAFFAEIAGTAAFAQVQRVLFERVFVMHMIL